MHYVDEGPREAPVVLMAHGERPFLTVERAGHFWQEDCGPEAAQIIVDWISGSV